MPPLVKQQLPFVAVHQIGGLSEQVVGEVQGANSFPQPSKNEKAGAKQKRRTVERQTSHHKAPAYIDTSYASQPLSLSTRIQLSYCTPDRFPTQVKNKQQGGLTSFRNVLRGSCRVNFRAQSAISLTTNRAGCIVIGVCSLGVENNSRLIELP
jgi:hypothetical protein